MLVLPLIVENKRCYAVARKRGSKREIQKCRTRETMEKRGVREEKILDNRGEGTTRQWIKPTAAVNKFEAASCRCARKMRWTVGAEHRKKRRKSSERGPCGVVLGAQKKKIRDRLRAFRCMEREQWLPKWTVWTGSWVSWEGALVCVLPAALCTPLSYHCDCEQGVARRANAICEPGGEEAEVPTEMVANCGDGF